MKDERLIITAYITSKIKKYTRGEKMEITYDSNHDVMCIRSREVKIVDTIKIVEGCS